MNEFVDYILFSKDYGKTYVGFTSNLIERFKSHNYLSKKGFTIKFRPWEVIYVEFFITKSEALKREKLFKTGKGREFIKEMISKL
jgi:putative endonuclease